MRSSTLTAATALLSASCSRTQTNSSAAESSNQPIRLGFNLCPGAIPWQIAEDQGFLKASGVNAEITWFQVLGDQINAFSWQILLLPTNPYSLSGQQRCKNW